MVRNVYLLAIVLFLGGSLPARGGLDQDDYIRRAVEESRGRVSTDSVLKTVVREQGTRVNVNVERQQGNGASQNSLLGSDLNGYEQGVLDKVRVKAVHVPAPASGVSGSPAVSFSAAWKQNITSTVFWVGEKATERSPSNERSAWDSLWMAHYGGYDTPQSEQRSPWYTPLSFHPRLNPFYVGLPYCDLVNGKFRPEAPAVIPWFGAGCRGAGISVCKDRWVAIFAHGRIAFAQWEDVGPSETDDWSYVFGPEPAPHHGLSQNAGIDVSPAVRSYLGLGDIDKVNWRFVEQSQVGPGPWNGWPAGGPVASIISSR
jgi:hypothetical protein